MTASTSGRRCVAQRRTARYTASATASAVSAPGWAAGMFSSSTLFLSLMMRAPIVRYAMARCGNSTQSGERGGGFRVTAHCGESVLSYRRERVWRPPRIALRFRSPPSLLLPGVSRVANGLPRIGPCADGAARRLGCPLPVFACLIFARPPAHRAKHTSWAFFGESAHGVRAARCKGYNPLLDIRFRKEAGTLTLSGAAGAVHRERCMEQHGYRAGIVAFA